MAEYGGGEAFLKWLRTDPKPQDQCEGSMEIRYTLTLDEFREGYGLMLRNTTFQHRLSYWFRSWLGPVLGLWILCCAFVILAGNGSFALVLVLCVVGVAALVAPLRFRMTLRSLSAAESGS